MTRETFFRRLATVAKGKKFYLTYNNMIRCENPGEERLCPIEAVARMDPGSVDRSARRLKISGRLKSRIMNAADFSSPARQHHQDRNRMLKAVGLA